MFDPIRALVYKCPQTIRPFIPIFGGILSLIPFGTIYTSGNVQPYIVSYMRAYVDPNLGNNKMVWIFTLQLTFPPLGVTLGGLLEKRFGPRIASLIGGFIMYAGVLLSYFTVQHSYGLLLVTFGMMFGLGQTIAVTQPIICAMRWLPGRKGLATGLVMSGTGLGGLLFNPIQTKFVNPDNRPYDENGYFHEYEVLNRVPSMFVMLGICYFVMQVFGSLLLVDPVKFEEENLETTPLLPAKKTTHVVLNNIKTWSFWLLFFCYSFNTPVITMTSSFYKSFGQTFITDDLFLATVGSISSILNTIGRVFWGWLGDVCSYQVAMCCAACLQCCLMLTFTAAKYGGGGMYLVWVCGLYLGFSSNFTLFPLVTAKFFGPSNFAVMYGFVSLSVPISSFIIAGIVDALLDSIGYSGIWFLSAVMVYCTFILTVLIQKTEYGRNQRENSVIDYKTDEISQYEE